MTYDDDREDPSPRRVIYAVRERVIATREQVFSELVRGTVSYSTKEELATAVMQYHDVLSEHSSEKIVREHWEDSDVDDIPELLAERVTIPRRSPGRTPNTEQIERPALMTLDVWTLLDASKELDQLAKELGFAARVREQTADPDDAVV